MNFNTKLFRNQTYLKDVLKMWLFKKKMRKWNIELVLNDRVWIWIEFYSIKLLLNDEHSVSFQYYYRSCFIIMIVFIIIQCFSESFIGITLNSIFAHFILKKLFCVLLYLQFRKMYYIHIHYIVIIIVSSEEMCRRRVTELYGKP